MILNNNFYTRKPTIPGLDAKGLNTDDADADDLHRSYFGAPVSSEPGKSLRKRVLQLSKKVRVSG